VAIDSWTDQKINPARGIELLNQTEFRCGFQSHFVNARMAAGKFGATSAKRLRHPNRGISAEQIFRNVFGQQMINFPTPEGVGASIGRNHLISGILRV